MVPELNYDLKLVVNTSIQQTLTRSIFTSATTFVMVLFRTFSSRDLREFVFRFLSALLQAHSHLYFFPEIFTIY